MTLQVEDTLKQGDREVHLPEPLKKVISCILAEMGVCEMMKTLPKFLNKAFRSRCPVDDLGCSDMQDLHRARQ